MTMRCPVTNAAPQSASETQYTREEIAVLRRIVNEPSTFMVPTFNPADGQHELRRICRKLEYNKLIELYDMFVIPDIGGGKRYTATDKGRAILQDNEPKIRMALFD
jgi:hypothetical protein